MKLSGSTAIIGGGILVGAGLIGYLLLEVYVFAPNREEAKKEAFFAALRGIYPQSHPKSGWSGRPVWSPDELKRWATGPRSRRAHVVHFRSRLTVNGYPVLFDEFVECPHGLMQGYVRKTYRPRRLISKKLPDGSVVFTVFLPQLCFNWQATRARIPVARDFKESVPSSKFLMRFYWADHATNPTRIEAYLSHAYHQQKQRRLVLHSHDVRQAPYPTPLKILQEAERQAQSDKRLTFLSRRGLRLPRWRALFGVSMSKTEWSKVAQLRRAVSENTGSSAFSDFDNDRLWNVLLQHKKYVGVDWIAFRYGVPHPSEKHHLLLPGPTRASLTHITNGLADRTRETLDEVMPVVCKKGICNILIDQRGYLIFYRATGEGGMHVRDLRFIELNGHQIRYRRPARLLYWRPRQRLIAVSATHM